MSTKANYYKALRKKFNKQCDDSCECDCHAEYSPDKKENWCWRCTPARRR